MQEISCPNLPLRFLHQFPLFSSQLKKQWVYVIRLKIEKMFASMLEKSTMRDVFQWLLVSSDPVISNLRLTPPKKSETLSFEAIQLLSPYMYGTEESSASEVTSNTSDNFTD